MLYLYVQTNGGPKMMAKAMYMNWSGYIFFRRDGWLGKLTNTNFYITYSIAAVEQCYTYNIVFYTRNIIRTTLVL